MRIIGFDVETVPQSLNELSDAQTEWLEGKVAAALERSTAESEEDVRSRIMGTTPYLGKIVCISLGEIDGNIIRTNSYTGDEKELLEEFWEILRNVGRTRFVSFNGLRFDVNFIMVRSMHHGVQPTNFQFLNVKRYQKFPHYDILAWLSDWGWPATKLEIVCDLLGVKSSKEGEIKAKDVAKAFEDGRIDAIAEYCEEDVRATLEVYLKVIEYIKD